MRCVSPTFTNPFTFFSAQYYDLLLVGIWVNEMQLPHRCYFTNCSKGEKIQKMSLHSSDKLNTHLFKGYEFFNNTYIVCQKQVPI